MRSRGLKPSQLDRFLDRYPDFARRSTREGGVRFLGHFERIVTADGLPDIDFAYRLEIHVSDGFPDVVPRVFEASGRIPKDYHRLNDGAFCLGSRLRLAIGLHRQPDLVVFFEDFVIPYLYRYAHLEKFGKEPWPDLPHNAAGLLVDNARILRASSPEMCIGFLELLSVRKRVANKRPCPCGAGVRLGRCRHHHMLNALRPVKPRWWFKVEAKDLRQAAGVPPLS